MGTQPAPAKWEYWPFREWLLEQMRIRGWRKIDIARQLNPETPVNMASNITRWLSGKRQPDPESCAQLADILGFDAEYVMAMAGHLPRPTLRDEAAAMRENIKAMVDRLSQRDLRALAALARSLHDESAQSDTSKEGKEAPRRTRSAAVVAGVARDVMIGGCWS